MANAKAQSSGNNKFLMVVIVLLLVMILGGGIGMFVFVKSGNSNVNVSKNLSVSTVTNAEQNVVNVSDKTYSFKDEFLLNLSDEGGKRYIKTSISIGYSSKNKKLDKELTEKDVVLKDIVVGILRSKKTTDFSKEEDIKKEILSKINGVLENGRAENIYFTSLLIQ